MGDLFPWGPPRIKDRDMMACPNIAEIRCRGCCLLLFPCILTARNWHASNGYTQNSFISKLILKSTGFCMSWSNWSSSKDLKNKMRSIAGSMAPQSANFTFAITHPSAVCKQVNVHLVAGLSWPCLDRHQSFLACEQSGSHSCWVVKAHWMLLWVWSIFAILRVG